MSVAKEFDVIIYGSTGYTGRLVAEYMAQQYGIGEDAPKWAMAGRSLEKLEEVRDLIGAPKDTPLVVADSDDAASIDMMASRTKVVLTTVGPYQLYGDELVAACVKNGTHYVDLCGEPGWMRAMIDQHQEAAEKSGAQICFSCGFDSIPFDLGVLMLQKEMKKRFGKPAARVKGRVRAMEGTFSGGTAASLKETMKAIGKNPGLVKILSSSFGLTPGFEGPDQPNMLIPKYDKTIDSWVAPFIMAAINTKNVHRTNFLLDFPFGEDFKYDEMVVTSPGDLGKQAAEMVAKANPFGGDDAPKPGEGPTKEQRENGFYDILFLGETQDGEAATLCVKGDKDPGYGSTSKMIAESALCLAQDKIAKGGGVWTPGALMGKQLVKRLEAKAGLSFVVES
ncbi:saccharopine dehydrogenase NADP-binding domain-containing protein [uncultured Parasphingorhabdus sp.]|uniref:saccharopine dehydrogenase family protein n=1 Tax=uncultured Parasphingorhabdus sp. TaxID=2709694 RepID=UPI002AA6703F|nr:saccharopine dehydrogenase NADP-binding domain-containing protein [uncultured Parasphingorhabdus sp.]